MDNLELGRRYFGDRLIANESYSFTEAGEAIASGQVCAVSFGRHFIANPDLVERWRQDLTLADFDLATLYTEGAQGYVSYPACAD